MKLIDAARCPYCARVRIALAEKGIDHEAVVIDLSDRPRWVIELNPPSGRVPVLDDGFVLPESEVIMEYLEERYPEPAAAAGRPRRARPGAACSCTASTTTSATTTTRSAAATTTIWRGRLEELEVGQSLYADVAYVPWVIRARDMLGVELPGRIAAWLAELEQRPSIAAEVEIVKSL